MDAWGLYEYDDAVIANNFAVKLFLASILGIGTMNLDICRISSL
jgi:hypothetical protein